MDGVRGSPSPYTRAPAGSISRERGDYTSAKTLPAAWGTGHIRGTAHGAGRLPVVVYCILQTDIAQISDGQQAIRIVVYQTVSARKVVLVNQTVLAP